MDSNVVIKIIDSDNSFDFEIPVSSDINSPFNINKELSDLSDPTKKGGVQSRPYKIAISKDIATNYDFFNEAQHHNYKDVDADKEAAIIINGNEAERGKIRVTGYHNKDGVEYVKLLFFGNNFAWTELGKELTMSDITWATTNATYSPAVIKGSWIGTVANGNETVYPLENKGGRIIANGVHTEDFRPAFYLYTVISRFLQNIGYTLNSTFMETTAFKKLVLTHFGKRFRHTQYYIDSNAVFFGKEGTNSLPVSNNDQTVNGVSQPLYLDKPANAGFVSNFTHIDSTSPFSDSGGNFDPAGGTNVSTPSGIINSGRYIAPKTAYYNIEIYENIQYGIYNYRYINYSNYVRIYDTAGNLKGGTPTGYTRSNEVLSGVKFTTGGSAQQGVEKGSLQIYLKAGEGFEVWKFLNDGDPSTPYPNSTFNINWWFKSVSFRVYVKIDKRIAELDTFNFVDVLDDNVKVLDIINDVSRMFNLFWETDEVLKEVSVEPRDDYYGTIANAVDFTDRLDLKRNIITKYNSSTYKSNMIFRYAKDSADKYVSKRDEEQNSILAEYTHSLPSKFKEGTTTVKLNVLAASYIIEDKFSIHPDFESQAPFTTRYWNEFTEVVPEERLDEHAPRILNYSYGKQQSDGTKSGGALVRKFRFYDESIDRTFIPAVLPHQIEIDGTVEVAVSYNLYWHTVGTYDGLFIDYWSKTITEIINGTNVMCTMYFNDKQWLDFKFSDIVYLSEPVEMKGYWLVESLKNYQPENSKAISVKLLNRVEWDVTAEGTTVYEADPVIGNESSRLLNTTTGMTGETTDENGNPLSVPMTTETTTGTEIPLAI